MNNAALTDIKNLIDQEFDDLEPENFLDFFNEIKEVGQKLADLAQNKIQQKVDQEMALCHRYFERVVDSFGGVDCTMRQSKGE